MKKKLYVKRTVSLLSLFLAVLFSVGLLQEYFLANFDHNTIRMEGFYLEEENSLDVVFLGASDVYQGFSSGLAYDEFGFTSYPLTVGANSIALYKSQLKEVLAHQSPQLIVVEINGALYGDSEYYQKTSTLHYYLDSVPFSQNKLDTIQEVVPEDLQSQFYFPFLQYHGAWKDLRGHWKYIQEHFAMQQRGYSLLKGCILAPTVAPLPEDPITDLKDDDSTRELLPEYEEGLRDFLQFCRDNDLPVLFVRFPHQMCKKLYARYQRSNRAGEIIEEYGYEYLNLEKNYEEAGIDLAKDFASLDHLNVHGNEKLTRYLSRLLCTEYGVSPRPLSPEGKKRWENAADYTKRLLLYTAEQESPQKAKVRFGEDAQTMAALEKIPSQK